MNTSPIQEYPPSVHSSSYSYDGDYQRYENPTKRSQNGRKRRSNTLRKREQTKCSLRRSEGYGSSSSSTAQSATPSNDSLEQRVASKGYSDGYLTAKIFAQYGTSKLGFIGQYIHDSIATLGPTVVPPTTEDLYSDRFMKGLRAGEDAVRSNLANS